MMENNDRISFQKYQHDMIFKGLREGNVFLYPPAFIDYLRPYTYGGVPLTLIMLVNEVCNGRCYDRAKMVSLAFDDATLVYGDIESLRCQSKTGNPEHAFIETREFGRDRTWVVDTSMGLIFDKDFYYDLEKVKVNKVYSKEQIMQMGEVYSVLSDDFESQKYVLTFWLPIIESVLESSNRLGTAVYKDFTKHEIEKLKSAVGYAEMKAEVDEEFQLFLTNPSALDEKYQIVYDRHGREISRKGKTNPYYISADDVERLDARFIETGDFSVLDDKVLQEIRARIAKEDEELISKEKARLEEILKAPTVNFYEREPVGE